MFEEPLIFELSSSGRRAFLLPESGVPSLDLDPVISRKESLDLPEVSQQDLVRHFVRLSQRNMGVDTQMYPLGSCTMKYNPKINEELAALECFSGVHPLQDVESCQGNLELLWELEEWLKEISGMDAVSLQPSAGAHGELTALWMIKAFHISRGRNPEIVLVPDSSHGTNPASAALCGFKVETVPSDSSGKVDLEALKQKLSPQVACMMVTNPNTAGVFEKDIKKIAQLVHEQGALLYYDGANLNAVCGITRPGDMGCDLMHFNVHKTFSAPHGGGGPGAGPVAVKKELEPFLPVPRIKKKEGRYFLEEEFALSIGKVRSFYGNVGVLIKGLAYLKTLGASGLTDMSRFAVLNANYLLELLAEFYHSPYGRRCMHEFVLSVSREKKERGISALDVAKRLADFGYHAPTIYFPLIVPEAIMIEPTETESRETLEKFARVMLDIKNEALTEPEKLKQAPSRTSISRMDEVAAARKPIVSWRKLKSEGSI
jgi:glycine dehydrogenase subunit 2